MIASVTKNNIDIAYWRDYVEYPKGSTVLFNNIIYMSLENNKGNHPFNSKYWRAIT